MPFENFCSADTSADHRRLKTVALIFCGLTIYLSAAFYSFIGDAFEEKLRAIKSNRPHVAGELCGAIPIPPGFVFISKNAPLIEGNSTTIISHYRTYPNYSKTTRPYIEFLDDLKEKEWRSVEGCETAFKKDHLLFSIIKNDLDDTEYQIQCRVDDLPPENSE